MLLLRRVTSKPTNFKDFDGYIATDPIAIFQAHYSLKEMGKSEKISALLLDGPPGVGKTFLGKHLSKLLKAELIHFQVFPGCDRGDMIWDTTYAKTGGTEEGVLLQSIKKSIDHPVVLLLDELDKSDVRVDSFLLNFLNEGFLFIPQLGMLNASSKNLLIVITKNDLRDAAAPLLRRCRVVYMNWPTVEIETRILRQCTPAMTDKACAALLEIPNRLRINPEVIKPPSTSELMRMAPDLLELVQRDANALLLGEYFINAIAQNVKDRRFIEKSPLYIGMSMIESLTESAGQHVSPTPSLLEAEVNFFINAR